MLGERHREKQTDEPYESGIVSTGTARVRFDIKFYLIAMFFVIFDLEAVFIFAWAVSIRETGWTGYCGNADLHRRSWRPRWYIYGNSARWNGGVR